MKHKPKHRILQKPRHYTLQCKRGRDNKDYYNSDGWMWWNRWATRVPSLKASKRTWENFYKLFPVIKKRLMNPESVTYMEGTDVIVEKLDRLHTDERGHTVLTVKTRKYKKIW